MATARQHKLATLIQLIFIFYLSYHFFTLSLNGRKIFIPEKLPNETAYWKPQRSTSERIDVDKLFALPLTLHTIASSAATIIIILTFSGQFQCRLKQMQAEGVENRCFGVRFTFHTEQERRRWCDGEKHTEQTTARNSQHGKYYWQMNGWGSLPWKARSEIKIFNIFRYPFYTCCDVASAKTRNFSDLDVFSARTPTTPHK